MPQKLSIVSVGEWVPLPSFYENRIDGQDAKTTCTVGKAPLGLRNVGRYKWKLLQQDFYGNIFKNTWLLSTKFCW